MPWMRQITTFDTIPNIKSYRANTRLNYDGYMKISRERIHSYVLFVNAQVVYRVVSSDIFLLARHDFYCV
uniref:Uncharacterized protein n=1 Tax=Pararge aegeria TaxID=116150 RepID=S4PQB6_9NEOP